MGLYVVTANTYEDDYGVSVELFGVYSNADMAEKRKYEINKQFLEAGAKVTNVDQDEDCRKYLDSYIE